jgi:hypothetical protein
LHQKKIVDYIDRDNPLIFDKLMALLKIPEKIIRYEYNICGVFFKQIKICIE